jgi:hypothetical protein
VVGALAGRRLGTVPEQTLTWSAFARRSPRADVLAPPRRSAADYGRNPYLGYDKPSSPAHLFAGPGRTSYLPPVTRNRGSNAAAANQNASRWGRRRRRSPRSLPATARPVTSQRERVSRSTNEPPRGRR